MSKDVPIAPSDPTTWCTCLCYDCHHSDHCEDIDKGCLWHKEPKFYVPPALSAGVGISVYAIRAAGSRQPENT